MRLGTKILLLILAATVGLSGTVIWLVTRDVTAREIDRARHTIKWAVSGYFESVVERLVRDARLVNLLMHETENRVQLSRLEEGTLDEKPFAQRQLSDEICGRLIQGELTFAGISPAFHVILNGRGDLRVVRTADDTGLAKALATQSWPQDDVLSSNPLNPVRKYLWINNSLYLVMGVPIHMNQGDEPSHAYLVGYRVDDQWLGKLLYVVRE